jgi:hypothetical protein
MAGDDWREAGEKKDVMNSRFPACILAAAVWPVCPRELPRSRAVDIDDIIGPLPH